jgi:hypothetical protein
VERRANRFGILLSALLAAALGGAMVLLKMAPGRYRLAGAANTLR